MRDPEEIRRGPAAPVRLAPTDDVYCDFFPRANRGGNPKFRCFMMSGPRAEGGRYYDVVLMAVLETEFAEVRNRDS